MPTGFGGGGTNVGPTTNLRINSLGVGVAPDNTAGDALINAGLATGGNAAPATAGDVYIGRASSNAVGLIGLGNTAAAASCQIVGGTNDAGSNATLELEIGTTPCFIVGNVYNRLRSGLVFSNLPAPSSNYEGAIASITDSNTAVWGATVAGGGANHIMAYCDGTHWTVAAI